MSRYSMNDQKMALVASLAQQGKSLQEIAAGLHISEEMARSAARKWPLIERMKQNRSL